VLFCLITAVFSVVMIYSVAPKYGTTNPLYYLSICAATGAVSVMALKAFGIALKLTFAGANQFGRPSTYLFAVVAIGCIVVQMNYFNKALNTFPQSMYDNDPSLCRSELIPPYSVSPIYYVTFTTAVLTASFVLFQGFNMTNPIETGRLLCGFLIIFFGVYMLNFPSKDVESHEFQILTGGSVLAPESLGILRTRFSMQGLRPSGDSTRQMHSYEEGGDVDHPRRSLARPSGESVPLQRIA
jgi:hypothetical protein